MRDIFSQKAETNIDKECIVFHTHSHRCLKVVYGAVKSANATMLGVFDGFYLETCVFMFKRVFFLFEIRTLLFVIYSTDLEM